MGLGAEVLDKKELNAAIISASEGRRVLESLPESFKIFATLRWIVPGSLSVFWAFITALIPSRDFTHQLFSLGAFGVGSVIL